MNEFADALAGRVRNWTGLAEATGLDRVTALLGPIEEVEHAGPTERGSSRYDRTVLRRETPPAEIEVWSTSPETVVLVEWAEPPGLDIDVELGILGEPELDLQDLRVATGGRVHELVFSSRGLTLSAVLSPLDQRRVTHLQLYAASTTAYWLTRIDAGPRLHPSSPPTRL